MVLATTAIAAVRYVQPALERILADGRARLAKCSGNDIFHFAKIPPLGIEQNINAVTHVKIIDGIWSSAGGSA
jgi:hypothetical protein